jgi:hypothetical protein
MHMLQVSLLAGGRLLYHGACCGMVPFLESLGYDSHAHTKGAHAKCTWGGGGGHVLTL